MPRTSTPQNTPATTSLAAVQFRADKGWSAPLPASLNSTRTLVLAFGSSRHERVRGAVRELTASFPDSAILGCSTSGEIFGDALHDDSLSVGVIRLPRTTLRRAAVPVRGPEDSFAAGALMGEQLRGPGLRAVMVMLPGHGVNGSEFVRGVNSVLGDSIAVTGGLAGDATHFEKTWVIHAGNVSEGVATGVGFCGEHLRFGHGCVGGWDTFGPERLITRSSSHELFELDGGPALEVYKKYLGERARELPASALLFPLAIRQNKNEASPIVRTVLSVDESRQSMTFAGDVPEGWHAQLMRTNFDRLVTAAGCSAEGASGIARPEGPALCVAISCVGRRLVLGERTEEEIDAVRHTIRPGDALVGFYSYGEISPRRAGVRCDLQNQSMTITLIGEA